MSESIKQPILSIHQLTTCYKVRRGILGWSHQLVTPVDRVDIDLYEGETLGLVGESGCGKTTLALSILRIARPSSGKILFLQNGGYEDLLMMGKERLSQVRQSIQMIFQDPFSSMNPRMTISSVVTEPLKINRIMTKEDLQQKGRELLARVGISETFANRYPASLSGGQRQRVVIARALALNPQVIIADEPVSALDVSVQSQILNLLNQLKRSLNLSLIFISHNLDVVRYMSDRIAVMYLGKIVEEGSADSIYFNPKHPYSESLLSAIPRTRLGRNSPAERIILQGDVPDPMHPPSGCRFHPRCRYATEFCRQKEPSLVELSSRHSAACHYAEDLTLQGAERTHAAI